MFVALFMALDPMVTRPFLEMYVEVLYSMACGTLSHDTGHMSIWGIISIACQTSRNNNIRCPLFFF